MVSSIDPPTIAYFDRVAEDYAAEVARSEPDGDLRAFVEALPPGRAPVLDWGAGPGNTAALLAARDIVAEAVDASTGMAEVAATLGIAIRVEPFEALTEERRFRGIWSNFALCFAGYDLVPGLIGRAAQALAPGGVLHVGMPVALDDDDTREGDTRDRNGNRTTILSSATLSDHLRRAGLVPISEREGRFTDATIGFDYAIHLARKPAS